LSKKEEHIRAYPVTTTMIDKSQKLCYSSVALYNVIARPLGREESPNSFPTVSGIVIVGNTHLPVCEYLVRASATETILSRQCREKREK